MDVKGLHKSKYPYNFENIKYVKIEKDMIIRIMGSDTIVISEKSYYL